MVERINGTIKDNTIKVKIYENFDKLSKDIKRLMYYYNIERRHGGIVKEGKGKAPMKMKNTIGCYSHVLGTDAGNFYLYSSGIFRKNG